MDPIQALAILSLGAFVTVVVTALFYVSTVRPRLLEPVPLEAVGVLDATLREELTEQRAVIKQLNAALSHHTEQLVSTAAHSQPDQELESLQPMLRAQSEAVASLTSLLGDHSARLAGLDSRLSRHEAALAEQSSKLGALDRLEAQMGQLDGRLAQAVSGVERDPLAGLIQTQAEKLVNISARLDEWAVTRARQDDQLAEHARILAGLDREMAAQAQLVQRLDAKVSEHTTMLVTAATERREQAGRLDRILVQLGLMFPMLERFVSTPPLREYQDRLTDIKGIGPVYSSKLYEAKIHTFKQLAALTPEELQALISVPRWRAINAESWIEQAKLLAAQQDKVEHSS
jgi:uncharacterized coiled-coil protein SlyX